MKPPLRKKGHMQFKLRITPELYEAIRRAGLASGISANAEAARRLKTSLPICPTCEGKGFVNPPLSRRER